MPGTGRRCALTAGARGVDEGHAGAIELYTGIMNAV